MLNGLLLSKEEEEALEATWDYFDVDEQRRIIPPKFERKSLLYRIKAVREGTCKQGERADLTGCTPASDSPSPKEPVRETTSTGKLKATRGEMVGAVREGKGKDARVVLANGEVAPPHITPAMVPPAWTNVEVALDPNSDVLVTGLNNGKSVSIYNDQYTMATAAVRFALVVEMLNQSNLIDDQIAKGRQDKSSRDQADCTWLMREQATRVGGESDTKGLAYLYELPFSTDNIVGHVEVAKKGKNKGKRTYKLTLEFRIPGKKKIIRVPVKDQGTAEELWKRKKTGGNIEDAKFWLQSFGATTLEGRHVVETNEGVRLQFVGKEGVWHDHLIRNPDLAIMLLDRKASSEQRGGKLFGTNKGRVDKFIDGLDGGKFSPKDFRTKRANELAIAEISKFKDKPARQEEYESRIMEVAEKVSIVLGNKAQQCLESYINPAVFAGWRVM